jgi:hypothetical protein
VLSTSGHQLGKLRSFAAGAGADLGERPGPGLAVPVVVQLRCQWLPVRYREALVRSAFSVWRECGQGGGSEEIPESRRSGTSCSFDTTPSNVVVAADRRTGSFLATPARPLLQFGLATFRPLTLMEVATCRALHRLVLTAALGRCRPTALPLLPLTHRPPPVVRLAFRASSLRHPTDTGAGRTTGDV